MHPYFKAVISPLNFLYETLINQQSINKLFIIYSVSLLQDNGSLMLLTNTRPIFEELETNQVSLGVIQSSSAAGSFLDEVTKWQKRLQSIEGE